MRKITIDWSKKFPEGIKLVRDNPAFLDKVENEAWKVLESYGIKKTDLPSLEPWPEDTQPGDAYIAQRLLEQAFFARQNLANNRNENATFNTANICKLLHQSDFKFGKEKAASAGRKKKGFESPLKRVIRRIINNTGDSTFDSVLSYLSNNDYVQDMCQTGSDTINFEPRDIDEVEEADGIKKFTYILNGSEKTVSHKRIRSIISEILSS